MKGALTQLAALLAAGAALYAQDPAQAPAQVQEDPRAKAIREQYEEQLRRESQLVSVNKTNATLEEILEEFRRQTGVNIILDKRNIPDDYRIDEFKVQNEPFANALKALADKAELTVEYVSPTLIRLGRPPRVTFNFRDADVKVVIDMIARVSGANIIVSPDVKGSITLAINNVPWNEVLNAVVKTLGFTTVQENFGIIRIIHPDELLKQMETRVYRLKHIQPPPLYTAKLEENKLIAGRPIQPPTQIEEILRRFILKQVLETVLSKDAGGRVVGKLDFDPQTNAFIVRDTKVVLDRIEQILNALDVEPQQVLLDVKFISTTNEDLLQFGTSWSFGGQPGAGVRSSVLHPSSTPPPGIASPSSDGKFTRLPFGFGKEVGAPGDQFFLTEFDMTMAFRAFKRDRFTRLLQEPTIAVLDNTEATIFVGDTISYAETRATAGQLGELQFSIAEAAKSPVKVGFQLFVIPKVIPEANKVILTIIPQNDVLVPGAGVAGLQRFTLESTTGTFSIDLPHIRTSAMVTKLILESGRTAILGGLVLERTVFQDEGIPILKDIPIINYLFKQRNDTMSKEHLLIFVTPRIVRGGRASQEGLRELLRLREETERREFEGLKKDRGAGEMKK